VLRAERHDVDEELARKAFGLERGEIAGLIEIVPDVRPGRRGELTGLIRPTGR
jgi:hypothetical protein